MALLLRHHQDNHIFGHHERVLGQYKFGYGLSHRYRILLSRAHMHSIECILHVLDMLAAGILSLRHLFLHSRHHRLVVLGWYNIYDVVKHLHHMIASKH